MAEKIMNKKEPLFTNKGKIVFCHMCTGLNLIIHIAITALTVKILLDTLGPNSYRTTAFIISLIVSVVIQFILHALYILWFQIGYVEFHEKNVDIVTKFKTRTFPYDAYLFVEIKTHSFRESKVPMYFEFILEFKTDDNTEAVRLFTNQLYCFNELIKKFPELT